MLQIIVRLSLAIRITSEEFRTEERSLWKIAWALCGEKKKKKTTVTDASERKRNPWGIAEHMLQLFKWVESHIILGMLAKKKNVWVHKNKEV